MNLGYISRKPLKTVTDIKEEIKRLNFPLIDEEYYIKDGIPHYGE